MSYLSAPYCGIVGVCFSPIDFVRDPELWMYLIEKYRATTTAGASFAFELVAKRLRDSGNKYDLSSIQVCASGGEPCLAATGAAMLEIGMPPRSRTAAYGTAEVVVWISASKAFPDPSSTAKFMPNGNCRLSRAMGTHLAIVDPETHRGVSSW